MSRRGGRGGGGGGGKASVSKELLKRTAAEAGLDDRHLKVLTDITKPALFPDFHFHSSGRYWDSDDDDEQQQEEEKSNELVTTKRPASTVYIMNKQRELLVRMQSGPHYVRPSQQQQQFDVIRYSTRSKPNLPPDATVLASFSQTNDALATDERYFPAELLLSSSTKKKADAAAVTTNHEGEAVVAAAAVKLEDLTKEHNDHEDDEEEEGAAGVEEEEEAEDYTTNYYNTDDESDAAAGDAEPTF